MQGGAGTHRERSAATRQRAWLLHRAAPGRQHACDPARVLRGRLQPRALAGRARRDGRGSSGARALKSRGPTSGTVLQACWRRSLIWLACPTEAACRGSAHGVQAVMPPPSSALLAELLGPVSMRTAGGMHACEGDQGRRMRRAAPWSSAAARRGPLGTRCSGSCRRAPAARWPRPAALLCRQPWLFACLLMCGCAWAGSAGPSHGWSYINYLSHGPIAQSHTSSAYAARSVQKCPDLCCRDSTWRGRCADDGGHWEATAAVIARVAALTRYASEHGTGAPGAPCVLGVPPAGAWWQWRPSAWRMELRACEEE